MKVLKDKYPKGSFKYQKTDGRYIDGYLYNNLKLLARRIVDDMTFLGICFSSTLEVGTGKSVFMTQIGEAWTEIINEMHDLDLEFTQNNIVFRPEDLIERAFQVPKYSFLLLDEWEDAHYWSKLGMTLRKFFRKCRQLNLFIIVIIPNFFQLPINYAVSRSIFAIDVKFEEGFERGFFDFYGFNNKKKLYIKGKKEHNYNVANSDFFGRFLDGYGVPESDYRRAKYEDMLKYDKEEKKVPTEREIRIQLARKIYENLDVTQKQLGDAFSVSERTINAWINEDIVMDSEGVQAEDEVKNTYNILQNKEIDYSKEQEVELIKEK